MREKKRTDKPTALVTALLLAALVLWAARELLPAVLPLLLGGALAALLHPAAAGLCDRLGCGYRLAAVLTAVSAALLLGLFLWGLGGVLITQGSALLEKLPDFLNETMLPLAEEAEVWWEERMALFPGGLPLGEGTGRSLGETAGEIFSFLSAKLLAAAGSFLSALPGTLLTLSFTVLSAFLFLMDYRRVTSFLIRILPAKTLRPLVESKRFLIGSVRKVVAAYLSIMLITFGEISLGLWLLRVPYFAVIGFGIALLDILPFIGSGLILIPWGLLETFLLGHPSLGVGLLLLYAVVSVVRFFLEPRIVGGKIGLHPLATLTAMAAGLRLFGFWGFVLAPLLVTLLVHLERKGMLRPEDR